jgi:tRNA nucleotidyltransferase/poly(A) polymerase
MRPEMPEIQPAAEIAAELADAGHEVYAAGGAVRDLLRGLPPKDLDLVTSASPREMEKLFAGRNLRAVGRSFRVLLVDGVEVSCFRGPDSFRPEPGEPGRSIQEDLSRRDLTVNSMAMDMATGRLVDPFGGADDLKRGVIRFTGDPAERIAEDPCRVVRACRFLALLQGRFARESRKELERLAPRQVRTVAPERLRLEILKAMDARRAGRFFRSLLEIGALEHIFPSLAETAGQEGGPNHADDVFTHSMLAGDAIPTRCRLLKLAAYIHDSGKPEAAEVVNGRLKFIGHEKESVAFAARELDALAFSTREIRRICGIIANHMHDFTPRSTPRAGRRLLKRLRETRTAYLDFLRLRVADRKANRAKAPYTLAQIRTMLATLEAEGLPRLGGSALTVTDLAISGEDVMRETGLPQGPRIGRVLGDLLDRVVEEPELNERETLLELLREKVSP